MTTTTLPEPAQAIVRGVHRRGTVVLLLDHRTATWVAIRRAVAMAEALDAVLHVVVARPEAGTEGALVTSHVADLVAMDAPQRGFELEIVTGAIAERGCEVVGNHDVVLVVVDARFGARAACRLADDAGVPVLVARDARTTGEWIAATDMRHRRYPVLAKARALARPFARDVVFFHNAQPAAVFGVGDPMGGFASYVGTLQLEDEAAAAKCTRLVGLTAREATLHSHLARSGSTVDALLELARERDADMVVVGHHRRSWIGRWLRGTAERIVERSQRSVVIVPLDRSA